MALTYKKSGVDYESLDFAKRAAQLAGVATKDNLKGSGFKEIINSRGESAYVIENKDCYFAFVEEGLGSKNLIADQMQKITGKSYYDAIGYDTLISITMDLVSMGAKPLVVLSYWAVGDSFWFNDKKRLADFVTGWKTACDEVGVNWGGGETPTLKDIINPDTIDLAGAAFGVIQPKDNLILGDKLQKDDVIILFESSGIHVNGLTLARKLADNLPKGFATRLPNGKMYGEELLKPTLNYSNLVADFLNNNIDIHYLVNITGHGWRKLMRAKKSFTYVVDAISPVPEIFTFIKKHSGLSDREMYATFNMGAGFALFISKEDEQKVLNIAKKHQIKAWVGGRVAKGKKQVTIKPLNIIYAEDDLKIR